MPPPTVSPPAVVATTAPPAAPTVRILAPTAIRATTMTLNATVKANQLPTTARFEYGTSANLSGDVQWIDVDDVFQDASVTSNVTCFISELRAGTTYYFRVVATNPTGTSKSDIISIRTTGSSSDYR